VTPADLAQVQRRAQQILDVARLTVGQVDRTACVDGQQYEAANAALRQHVDARWGDARDLAALALVLVDELGVSRALIDDLEARLASSEAGRLSAVASSDRRLGELSGLRVALMTVELFARKARCS
jgi:hypothetical protein